MSLSLSFFLSWDPLNLTRIVCVTLDLGLAVGAWQAAQWLHNWRQWLPLSQNGLVAIVASSSSGRGRAHGAPSWSIAHCWISPWIYFFFFFCQNWVLMLPLQTLIVVGKLFSLFILFIYLFLFVTLLFQDKEFPSQSHCTNLTRPTYINCLMRCSVCCGQ